MRSLLGMIEALLFVSGDALTIKELCKATEWDEEAVSEAIGALKQRFESADSGLQLVEIAGGWQLSTRTEYAPIIGKLLAPNANRLSRPSLETVTIVAYRQPCTQAEIEAIRGVSCDGVLKTLVDRELIEEAGRKQTPGRPILYATTGQFLHYFGLASIDDLPPLPDDLPTEADQQAAQISLEAAGAL
jgi:segregation and condensation protein B